MTQRLFLNKDLEASYVGDLQVWGRQGPSVTSGKRAEQQGVCPSVAVTGKFK